MQADLPEGWEYWLAFFAARLPSPVRREDGADGCVSFSGGTPSEVVVELTRRSIRVGRVVRVSTAAPDVAAHWRWIGRVYWTSLPDPQALSIVEPMIAAARRVRRGTYRTCFVCGRKLPPELMADEEVCTRCAGRSGRPA